MPMFSKDYHGRERMPPLPVSFDRVNESQSSRSRPILLKLPIEVLNLIIQFVASDSLASLALVNRDCLQMARSRQFVSINLEYGSTSFQIFSKLYYEGQHRLTGAALTVPSLRSCIRHITVSSYPSSEDPNDLDSFTRCIQVLINPSITPHLELLDWENTGYCLPRSFFTSLILVSFWGLDQCPYFMSHMRNLGVEP